MSGKRTFDDDFEAWLKDGDAELSALYRKLPQAEPDARLDAAVLAMAHRSLNPHLVATPQPTQRSAARRRARWLPALSAAATAVFAIGIAVKMGPQWADRGASAPPAAARDDGVVHVRPVDAPAAPAPPLSPPPPPASQAAASNGLKQEAARAAAKPSLPPAPAPVPQMQKAAPAATAPQLQAETELGRSELQKVENVAPSATAPQAFPAQPARQAEMDAVERKQAIAEGAWQRLHEADSASAVGGAAPKTTTAPEPRSAPAPARAAAPFEEQRSRAPAAPAAGLAAPQAAAAESKAAASGVPGAADQQGLDTITVTGSNIRRVDVETASPVAPIDRAKLQDEAPKDANAKRASGGRGYSSEVLRNSRLYPESWMAAIQRLIRAGRRDEARQNLDLFRQKYPNYHLPDEVDRFSRDAR